MGGGGPAGGSPSASPRSSRQRRAGYDRAVLRRLGRMRLLPLFALALITAPTVLAQRAVEAPLDRVLRATVGADGLVDYAAIQRTHRADLDAALAAIEATDPSALRSDDARLAFLLNAYNAHVLDQIASGRVRSLDTDRARAGLYKRPVRVAGTSLTLDALENGVLRRESTVDGARVSAAARQLRPSAVDFRIHVGLNCGAVGCPRLRPRAFTAATVDAELDRAFGEFVDSKAHVAALRGGGLRLSSLLDWFGADFERGGVPLGDRLLAAMSRSRPAYATLRQRLAGKTAAELRRDSATRFRYDWTVNRR